MDELERLRAENEKLRSTIDGMRQREMEALREQLALALKDVDHYRQEAIRNADQGRKIYIEMQAEIQKLRDRLAAKEALPNARPQFKRS
jgi:hypothetical protein